MNHRHLRWLRKERPPTPAPQGGGADRDVPAWFEPFLEALTSLTEEAVDWSALAGLARRILQADVVRLWQLTPEARLRLLAAVGDEELMPGAERAASPSFLALQPGMTVVLSLQAGTVEVGTAADETDWRRAGLVTVLIVPVHSAGRLVGRIDVGRRQFLPFDESVRMTATMLAALVGALLGRLAPATPAVDSLGSLLHEALAAAGSAREAVAQFLEGLRFRCRASCLLLIRWLPDERPALVAAVPGTTTAPDPAILASARVRAVLRSVLAEGRSRVLERGTEFDLLFPSGASRIVVTPLAPSRLGIKGLLVASWSEYDADGERVLAVASERFGASLHTLLAFVEMEERLGALAQRISRSESLVRTLVGASEPAVVVEAIWRSLAEQSDLTAVGLVVQSEALSYWQWIVAGKVQPAVLRSQSIGPLVPILEGGAVVSIPASRWNEWRDLLPPGLFSGSLLVAPFASGRGALVAAVRRERVERELEEALEACVAFLTGAESGLLAGFVRQSERARERQAVVEALVIEDDERGEFVEFIHNVVLQGLASNLYRIELALRRADRQPLEELVLELEQVRDRLADQIAALRNATFQLRPATLDHLGLVAALRDYLQQLERERGLQVEFLGEVARRPPREVESRLYRIVRMLIERARLPQGISRLAVRLRERSDGGVLLVLADDGPWPGPDGWRTLPGMAFVEEWVRLLGGSLRVTGLPTGGVSIAVSIPSRQVQETSTHD